MNDAQFDIFQALLIKQLVELQAIRRLLEHPMVTIQAMDTSFLNETVRFRKQVAEGHSAIQYRQTPEPEPIPDAEKELFDPAIHRSFDPRHHRRPEAPQDGR